jgi:acetolactate synthase-1/2/3 large subunit
MVWTGHPDLPAVRAAFAERLVRHEPPMGFVRAIRAALPQDGIYVEEVTQVGFASHLAMPVFAPRTFLSPGYQDTLGWGYGTALGAHAAAPGRKVVLATGYGGFHVPGGRTGYGYAPQAAGCGRGVRRRGRSATRGGSRRSSMAIG